MACLLFHLLIGLTILSNTSLQAERDFGPCSSEVELTIGQREQHDEPTYSVNCKSRKKPFDDSAEFQVDGFSQEHILIINNRCFDRKKQECSFDYCECDPALNGFTVKFKMDHLTVGQTFGCLMRIRNDATGNFLKIFTSNLFNGTDFIPYECNVKVIGTTTDITNTTSNSSRPSDDIKNDTSNSLTIYLLILLVTFVIIILILTFLFKWFKRSRTEERSKTIKTESLPLTENRTQMLFEKNEGSRTEERSKTIETETLPLTENRTQMLFEKNEVIDYFTIKDCESDIIYCGNFYEEQRFKHEQGQELQHEQILRNERILDMGFVEHNNELCLVYIDADNKKIVRQSIIPGENRTDYLLKKQPNRLSIINDETVAVIYKKGLEVLIFNVKEMKEEKTCKMSGQHILESQNGIQGILALSENNFILSDKTHLYVLKMNENGPTVKKLDIETKLEFDTARRLTHAVTSDGEKDIVFIADENDKKITSITISPKNEGKESIAALLIGQQMDHNRGLQNVRAIVATQSRIYAATSAGISVYRHDRGHFDKCVDHSAFGQNSKDYKMLLEYNKHVEHTRSLCIHTSREYIYIALSCVIKQQDVILVFKLKPNNVFK